MCKALAEIDADLRGRSNLRRAQMHRPCCNSNLRAAPHAERSKRATQEERPAQRSCAATAQAHLHIWQLAGIILQRDAAQSTCKAALAHSQVCRSFRALIFMGRVIILVGGLGACQNMTATCFRTNRPPVLQRINVFIFCHTGCSR